MGKVGLSDASDSCLTQTPPHTHNTFTTGTHAHALHAFLLSMLPSLSRRMTAAAVKPSTLLPLTSPPLHASLFDSTTSFTPAATTARVLHLRRPRPRWLSTGVPQDEVKEGGPPRKKQPSFSFSGAEGGGEGRGMSQGGEAAMMIEGLVYFMCVEICIGEKEG